MELLKKNNGQWIINSDALMEYVKSLNNDANILDLVRNYILACLASNYAFMSEFVFYCRHNILAPYVFDVVLEENGLNHRIYFSLEMFIKYYEEETNSLNTWQRVIYKLLKHYKSDGQVNKALIASIPEIAMSYYQLKELLLLPTSEFTKEITNNPKLGQNLYNFLFEKYAFIDNFKLIFEIDDKQLKLLEENLEVLDYNYEPNLLGDDKFKTIDYIPGYVNLNDKLIKEIIGDMPEDFDDLEKAYYIYYRLCQKFYYDEEYFCYCYGTVPENIKDKPMIDHADIRRLNNIDVNSGVICNEITMIYVQFLKLLGLPYQICGYYDNQIIRYGKTHMRVRFKVGEYIVYADAGNGVFNSDMSAVKIFQETNSFTLDPALPCRIKDDCLKKMKKVEDYIESKEEENEFNDALDVYENLFVRQNNTSFEEKITILKSIIERTKSPFIVMFSWVEELVDKIFGQDSENCHAEFIINYKPTNPNQSYELALVIIYNKHEGINEDYTHNSYLVITENRQEELLDYTEFKRRTEMKIYDYTSKSRKKKYDFGEDLDANRRNRKP